MAVSSLAYAQAGGSTAKNVILFIGDGMSFEQLKAARLVKGAPLTVDGMAVQHQARNASLNNSVTDSAAAGTALATGQRTNNGMVAITPDGKALTSSLRFAQQAGKRTGVVVTDKLSGATPGAFIANVKSRNEEPAILEQAIFQTQPFVLMGGGMSVYNQIGAAARLSETGYTLIQTRDQLLAWDTQNDAKLLGLFASSTMTYMTDRKATEPHIAEMVQVALQILSRDEDGFFLMVEGSRIDHAGHANDLRRSVFETLAFDEAVAVALAFAAERNDTLVVVTADHETGGLVLGSEFSPHLISKGADVVSQEISSALAANPDADIKALFAGYAGITDLKSHVVQGNNITALLRDILRQRSFYYTTDGHTNAPVPVIAQGPGAEAFATVAHIADVGQLIINIVSREMGGDRS